MKKEWSLLLASATLTLLLALGLIRWFAPQLLGIPIDLQMVRVSEEVPPFFDGVFRREDYQSRDFILKDPYIQRAKPLYPDFFVMGPNDILGFRNRGIPNIADIVTIGDSQTYGNNAALENNWPGQLRVGLGKKGPVVYNMSVGGWGAVEYYEIFLNATLLQPRIVIVAFYTGNDPLESFRLAHANDRWRFLRPDSSLGEGVLPGVPPAETRQWPVVFADGVKTVFTPAYRYASNQDHPTVRAGYAIMKEVARLITKEALKNGITPVFTVIPTKELVYAEKVRQAGQAVPEDYDKLIKAEASNIAQLAVALSGIPGAFYIDVVAPLQTAALDSIPLYPANKDGHPLATGYRALARALIEKVEPLLSDKPEGLFSVKFDQSSYQFFLARDDRLWRFKSADIIARNGWKLERIPVLQRRDIANIAYMGTIDTVDTEKYGPRLSTND